MREVERWSLELQRHNAEEPSSNGCRELYGRRALLPTPQRVEDWNQCSSVLARAPALLGFASGLTQV